MILSIIGEIWEERPRSILGCQGGGGYVMIWGCFSFHGKSKIGFLGGRWNSSAYCNSLQYYLFEFAALDHGINWKFKQDAALIHVSAATKRCIVDNSMTVIEWPAWSADINLIERISGLLANGLYPNGKRYDSVAYLENGIKQKWLLIGDALFQSISSTMRSRCPQELQCNGAQQSTKQRLFFRKQVIFIVSLFIIHHFLILSCISRQKRIKICKKKVLLQLIAPASYFGKIIVPFSL